LLWRWLPRTATAIPAASHLYDAQLIVFILAWVAHALATDPGRLFDAPIDYPAPAQLTGSDHFLSTQLLFAPVFWLSGNAVLAANLVAMASYPLAALAMNRLLRAVGAGAGVAWVGGLLFALGPRRVPINLQMLQYLNLYLPLVALALVQLRGRPAVRAAGGLALAWTAGIFSSYYGAVLLGLTAAVWGVCETFRERRGRLRFILVAGGVALAGVAALVVFARPYFARGELESAGALPPMASLAGLAWSLGAILYFAPAEVPLALLVALGVAGGIAGVPTARRLLVPGLVLAVVGLLLSTGLPDGVAAVLAASPLRFLRYLFRFDVIAGFGYVLLLVGGLETVRRAAGALGTAVAVVVVAALVVVSRGALLAPARGYDVPALARNAAVYREVARLARAEERGPLLELPIWGPPDADLEVAGRNNEPDAMIGSTLHWLPLLNGYTGYHAPHRRLFLDTTNRLPRADALDDLVDMTHVRWLLLRPAEEWKLANLHDSIRELVSAPAVGRTQMIGKWMLVRLDRVPAHPGWFAALQAGRVPGRTLLGTPLAPLPEEAAVAIVTTPAPSVSALLGWPVRVTVEIRNAGTAAWPVTAPPENSMQGPWLMGGFPLRTLTVRLYARWTALEAPDVEPPPPQELALRRDVPAGEALEQDLYLTGPKAPGRYGLELRAEQVGGARFDGPGNMPLHLEIVVVPRA
jgi:hypothetical protein